MGSEGNHGLQESNVETGTYLPESREGLISGTFLSPTVIMQGGVQNSTKTVNLNDLMILSNLS